FSVTSTGNITSTGGALVVMNGNGAFSYDPRNAAALQELGQGETLVDTFNYTVSDATGSSVGLVQVTVTGANDAPVISVGAGDAISGNVTESDAGNLTVSDTLTVTDIDRTDIVLADVQGVVASGVTAGLTSDNTALRAMLGLSPGTVIGNTATSGTLTWTFDSNTETFDYLGQGESLVLTYTVRVTDDSGAGNNTANQTVTVTVTGSNDAPVISVGAGDAISGTVAETNAGNLTVSDTLTVTDLDRTDIVTPSVVSVVASGVTAGLGSDNAALLAMLGVSPGTVIGNAATSGTLTWTFNSGTENFNYLGQGESLVLTYTVRVTDDSGAGNNTANQAVTVTVTGTNDAPIISIGSGDSATGTVAETNAGNLAVSDTLTVTDLDRTDIVSSSVTGVVASGTTTGLGSDNAALLAMFGVSPGTVIGNAATGGALTWTFDSGAENFNYLAQGESLVLTYTVQVADDSGAGNSTANQTVTVTVTGTNDAPVITIGGGDSTSGNVTETDAGNLSTSGTLTVTDLDLSNTVSASVVSVTPTGDAGGIGNATLQGLLSVNAGDVIGSASTTGTITWTFDSGLQTFDHLAQGEVLTLAYTVRATDSSGGTGNQTVTVTVTGSNDAPVANDDTVSVNNLQTNAVLNVVTGASPAGVVADTDVDGDTLTIVAFGPDAGNLTAVGGTVVLASGATITLSGNNAISYNAQAGFGNLAPGNSAADSFVYQVSDGNGGLDVATVNLTIVTNLPPNAVTDNYGPVSEDATLSIPAVSGVLANDSDDESD
ncbi:MAG: VCBS domain-containing protein, partial [Enhydrobacter sp.]|nr:VCBS domain-containing protein [Enhydrobacter sp.]